jgi:hypothetical protein
MDTTRTVTIIEDKPKKITFHKKNVPRVETKTWKLESSDLDHESQLNILNKYVSKDGEPEHTRFFLSHVRAKINNYKQQDIRKKIFDPEQFVKLDRVLQLLHDCQLECAYCSKNVYIFYNFVREASQWTLDRICNDRGHNGENLIIACLDCNLKRRCISKHAFMFTKKLVVEKID